MISNEFPISSICSLIFSKLLDLISYLCINYSLSMPYVCLYGSTFPFVTFLFLTVAFSFPHREAVVAKLIWWCWIFSFCLSLKHLISLLNLNESLSGESILDCRFYTFITLNILCHSLLVFKVSAKKPAENLLELPLYVMLFFPCCF